MTFTFTESIVKYTKNMQISSIKYWDRRGKCSVLVGKAEGNKPLGIHRPGWEDNIRMDLQENSSVLWTGFM
jgi:hypothetical protein